MLECARCLSVSQALPLRVLKTQHSLKWNLRFGSSVLFSWFQRLHRSPAHAHSHTLQRPVQRELALLSSSPLAALADLSTSDRQQTQEQRRACSPTSREEQNDTVSALSEKAEAGAREEKAGCHAAAAARGGIGVMILILGGHVSVSHRQLSPPQSGTQGFLQRK